MTPPTWTDEETAAFWRGFDLARPPGRQEIDALDRAEEVAPVVVGHFRVALPKDLARAILTEVEPLPEALAGATWAGFLRGMVAQAGGAPVHVHESGRA